MLLSSGEDVDLREEVLISFDSVNRLLGCHFFLMFSFFPTFYVHKILRNAPLSSVVYCAHILCYIFFIQTYPRLYLCKCANVSSRTTRSRFCIV